MKVNITARHLELTSALKEYAQKRLGHIKKLTDRVTVANIVFNVEKDRHTAEVTIGVSKNKINARATAGDMYAAMDLVIDKVVKQLKKHLEKMKDHKVSTPYSMVADLLWKDIEKNVDRMQNSTVLHLDDVRELHLKKQTIGEALKTIESRDLNFWIFKDAKEDSINVIFKNDDGTNKMLIIRG